MRANGNLAEIFTARKCLFNSGRKDESAKSERKLEEFRDGLRAREGLFAACHGRATMTHVPKSQFGETLEIRADRSEPAGDLANRQFDETLKGPAPPRLLNGARRTIRRNELRLSAPLADTTIYETEQRGEFPRRFNLASRCVVWYLAEVEAWIEQRCKNSYAARVRLAPSPEVQMQRRRSTSKSKRVER
jgi:prophage regulatory protein